MNIRCRLFLILVSCLACLRPALAAGSAPPNGFATVAASSNTSEATPNYGLYPRIALDANGDPMICFLWGDPNGDNTYSDTALYFTAWSRTLNKFGAPLRVAVTGDAGNDPAAVPISISRDPSNNTLGIAYTKATATGVELHLALSSDSGVTWKDQTVVSSALGGYHSPSLALAGGTGYLAYVSDGNGGTDIGGVRYQTGKETTAPAQWATSLAPLQSGYSDYQSAVSLALDSSGSPALVYVLGSDTTSDMHLVFWRGSAAGAGAPAILIAGTQGQGTDDPDVKLSFFGTQPRVVFNGAMDQNYNADYNHLLWAIRSTDNGATWAAPVNIPSDGDRTLDPPAWLALGSQGQAAVVSASDGGDLNGVQCSQPKLSTSDPAFAKWSTCGPVPIAQLHLAALSATAAYGPGDRLYIAFQVPPGYDLPYGVALWSQPAGAATGPAITAGGIGNAASFQPQISPGAIASIFGTGFLDTAAGAAALPLPTELDTAASKLTVTVNGEGAPLVNANSTQINFQVPWDIAAGSANVVVTVNGVNSNTAAVTVLSAAPGIFVYNGNRAVAQDSQYSVVGTANPAAGGSTMIVYMTGSGPVLPAVASGAPAPEFPNLSVVQSSVSATVGAAPAAVSFKGMAPDFVGLLQMNIVVPAGLTPGDYPLTVTINGQKSNSPLLAVGP